MNQFLQFVTGLLLLRRFAKHPTSQPRSVDFTAIVKHQIAKNLSNLILDLHFFQYAMPYGVAIDNND